MIIGLDISPCMGERMGPSSVDFKYNYMCRLHSTKVDVVFTEPALLPQEDAYWTETRAHYNFHRKDLGICDENSLGHLPPSGWRETYFQEYHEGVGGGEMENIRLQCGVVLAILRLNMDTARSFTTLQALFVCV